MQRDLSPRGIKKFAGRAELADALGISTKTLGRMVNNGSFPRPIKVSPNRVGWPVSVVQQYYEARLMAVSVDDPAKLKPDEIEDAAVELSARLMTNVFGESVSPDNVMIGAVKQLSPDDADTATNSQWLALWLAVEDRMGADAGDGVLDGELEGSMAGSGVIHGDGPVSVISLAAVVAAVVPGSRWDGRAKANKKMTTMAAISSADTGTSIVLKWE